MLRPATRLVEVARQTVSSVPEQHVANHLQSTSQQLSTYLAELRVALNNAQQLNFDMQLQHSEELIRELDNELIEIGRAAQGGQLNAVPGESAETATSKLTAAARQVILKAAEFSVGLSLDINLTGNDSWFLFFFQQKVLR